MILSFSLGPAARLEHNVSKYETQQRQEKNTTVGDEKLLRNKNFFVLGAVVSFFEKCVVLLPNFVL